MRDRTQKLKAASGKADGGEKWPTVLASKNLTAAEGARIEAAIDKALGCASAEGSDGYSRRTNGRNGPPLAWPSPSHLKGASMTLTTLDQNIALLVVDLQKGIVGSPSLHPFGEVVERSRALIDAFRSRRQPIVFINVAGGAPGRTEQPRRHVDGLADGFTDFIPELDLKPDDIVVTKRTWGAFASTDLEDRLKAISVTQVVIVGVATATGVESTARQAYEAGFNVTLAIDAMADARAEAHDYSIRNVFPRLGETGTSQEIIDLVMKESV